jgi:hypothetical protein
MPEISDGVSRLNPGAAPPWPKIWEHENASLDQDIMLQSLSTVAFLVDQAGWPAFIQFIKRIPASEGYQQALEEIYDVGLADLESRWRNYLPYYKTDRWRSNVLHGIDLGTHRALIEAGAYSEAKRALAETIPVIEQAEDTDLLQEAHQLLEISELGVEAYALLRRSRQSILEGEFEVALDFLEQARSIYLQIGEDRYMDDIELYTVRAAEVLALREDLLEIQSREAAMTEADTARLVSIGERLGELGDTAGYASAKQNLANVSARRNSRLILISFISLLVSFGLIAHRTHLIRREGAPESKLT